jgi:hypothetical protein
MGKRHLYHYSSFYNDGNRTVTIDGIAQLVTRITTQEDYMKLKPRISPDHHHKLSITSLSYLGKED